MSSTEPETAKEGKVPLYRWLDPRFWLRMILMLEDSPHSIALGSAIGMFIAFTPTVGIQQFIILIIAAICAPFFRFNIPAGIVMIYISNPITTAPIYWFNYKIGCLFCYGTFKGEVTYKMLIEEMKFTEARTWADFLHGIWQLMLDMGWPFLIGSFIVATVLTIPTYPLMYSLVKKYQENVKKFNASKKKHTEEVTPDKVEVHQ